MSMTGTKATAVYGRAIDPGSRGDAIAVVWKDGYDAAYLGAVRATEGILGMEMIQLGPKYGSYDQSSVV
jgi:hypothetical protein